MALFNHNYPYTDFHEMNLDWVIKTINEMDVKIKELETSVFEKSKEYIDQKIGEYAADVALLRSEFESFKVLITNNQTAFESSITSQLNSYKNEVNNILTIFEGRINTLSTKIDTSIEAINLRTDNAIAQNNNYIFEEVGKYITRDIKVRNLFTGERVSLQEMFDYLANLHTTGAITIDEIDDADKTVNEMIAYDETVTNFVINGKAIIV